MEQQKRLKKKLKSAYQNEVPLISYNYVRLLFMNILVSGKDVMEIL